MQMWAFQNVKEGKRSTNWNARSPSGTRILWYDVISPPVLEYDVISYPTWRTAGSSRPSSTSSQPSSISTFVSWTQVQPCALGTFVKCLLSLWIDTFMQSLFTFSSSWPLPPEVYSRIVYCRSLTKTYANIIGSRRWQPTILHLPSFAVL